MDAPLEAVARQLEQDCGIQVSFDKAQDWQTREQRFIAGEVDLAWTCGLLYSFRRKRQPNPWQPFAAVSLSAKHYQKRPIYFTEVVCLASSPFRRLEDLQASRFVYNDCHSLSGYYALWHTLKQRGVDTLIR